MSDNTPNIPAEGILPADIITTTNIEMGIRQDFSRPLIIDNGHTLTLTYTHTNSPARIRAIEIRLIPADD